MKGWIREVLNVAVVEPKFTLIPGFQPFKDLRVKASLVDMYFVRAIL